MNNLWKIEKIDSSFVQGGIYLHWTKEMLRVKKLLFKGLFAVFQRFVSKFNTI